jgi:hypothetical protein
VPIPPNLYVSNFTWVVWRRFERRIVGVSSISHRCVELAQCALGDRERSPVPLQVSAFRKSGIPGMGDAIGEHQEVLTENRSLYSREGWEVAPGPGLEPG